MNMLHILRTGALLLTLSLAGYTFMDIEHPSAQAASILQDLEPAAGTPAPDAAEQALVEHAPTLEKMATPNTSLKQAVEVEAQKALVRPLPKKYLVVRKNAGSGALASRLNAARSALADGRYQAALELLDRLAKDYPRDTRVQMGRAIALQNLGQDAAALAAYEKILKREPKNVEALTNMLGLLRAKNSPEALTRLKALQEQYPARSEVAAQLGIAYGTAGDYGQALKYLDVANALSPQNPSILYNQAVVYDHMGDTFRAAEFYRRLLARAAAGDLDQSFPLETIRARLAVLR